ncbi:MAG TPA: GreA/GreB family elongation factor [Vicinamibacteria bacterium]|nr:GreA/GreB family elongation factor [Vicinamibacteria bacterium]
MPQRDVRVTEVDSRRLQALIDAALPRQGRDAGSVEALERHLLEAEITPPSDIGADVVTMNSEVLVTDLDTGEALAFRLVFPRASNVAAGNISVLAPLGMAVLGRKVGEDLAWRMPAGTRRLRVDALVSQPERDGKDLALGPVDSPDGQAS